jgi:hypothetical protein
LSFVILGWLIARIQQLGEGAGWRWLPVRIVCYPLPFLFLLFDSNVIAYYIVRWIVLFALPLTLLLKEGRRDRAPWTQRDAP